MQQLRSGWIRIIIIQEGFLGSFFSGSGPAGQTTKTRRPMILFTVLLLFVKKNLFYGYKMISGTVTPQPVFFSFLPADAS